MASEIINAVTGIAGMITALGVIFGLLWVIFKQYTKWEGYDKTINEMNQKVDDKIGDLSKEFNERIGNIEEKIDTLTKNTEQKSSDTKEELCMLTYCMQAVLEGLHQQGCNGPVTEAREKLSKYVNKAAHHMD